MDPYHDANAPPSYTDHQGQSLPPYASSYGEKNLSEGPGYQSVPQYPPYPQPGPPYPQPGQTGPPYSQPRLQGPSYPQPGPQYPQSGQPGPLYPQSGQPGPLYPQPGQQGPQKPQQAAPPHGPMSYVQPNKVQHPLPRPPTNVSVVQPPTKVVRNRKFGLKSTRMECPACHADIKTRVLRDNTRKTHITAGLLCMFCCWPCVCIPYLMPSCKEISHRCPKCKQFLGMYLA